MKYWNWRPSEGLNFGDELTGLLLRHLLPNEEHIWVEPEEAEIVAVGSILNNFHGRFKPGTIVWGSGGGYKPENVQGLKVLAVRGKYTRDSCGMPENTPLGDPAMLLPLFIEPAKKKRYKLGLVRHIDDRLPHERVGHDIDISCYQTPEEVIEQITSCELITSTSLHGFIVAFAYGIPCVPVPPDDGNKIMDFISVLGDRTIKQIQEDLLTAFYNEFGDRR